MRCAGRGKEMHENDGERRKRMAAGGERGKMCRTKHKNDFKKDSPVPSFRLFYVLAAK